MKIKGAGWQLVGLNSWPLEATCLLTGPVGGTESPCHRSWDPKVGPHHYVLNWDSLVGPQRHVVEVEQEPNNQ